MKFSISGTQNSHGIINSYIFMWRLWIQPLRNDLTDIARIAFQFNSGQSPGSILSPICTKNWIVKNLLRLPSNHLNHKTYSEPCFSAPQLYLLTHTLSRLCQSPFITWHDTNSSISSQSTKWHLIVESQHYEQNSSLSLCWLRCPVCAGGPAQSS